MLIFAIYVWFRNWLGRLCQDFTIAFEEHSSQIQKNKSKEEYVRSSGYAARTQTEQNGTHAFLKENTSVLIFSLFWNNFINRLLYFSKFCFVLFVFFFSSVTVIIYFMLLFLSSFLILLLLSSILIQVMWTIHVFRRLLSYGVYGLIRYFLR